MRKHSVTIKRITRIDEHQYEIEGSFDAGISTLNEVFLNGHKWAEIDVIFDPVRKVILITSKAPISGKEVITFTS